MKQTVEEAANEYCRKHITDLSGYVAAVVDGFKAGADWHEKQSPWINVHDRLPGDEQLVLTSSSIYGIKLLVWNGHYKVWDDEDGEDVYCERDKIDAWMPIPE